MSASRTEAVADCRRMLRGFSGAPDPRRHGRRIASTLAAATGWTPEARREIEALAVWLSESPPENALRLRCQAVLDKLA
ncbi:hypothetical protein ACETK8_20575 (plasmid) [Brevundimonas staleyi]|uniref:Uncharacterized protein n=1 Tax=Brevundimonas staleyi TaxID=74326 RepID=A0ABW0FPP7_9CAUL